MLSWLRDRTTKSASLRTVYEVPGAWPEEVPTRPSLLKPPLRCDQTPLPPSSTPQASPDSSLQAVSSPAVNPEARSSTLSQTSLSLSASPEGCSRVVVSSQENPEDYNLEFVTHLLAAMLNEDDLAERRENELIYHIQQVRQLKRQQKPSRAWKWEEQTRQWCLDGLVQSDVRRAVKGEDRSRHIGNVKRDKMVGGWVRDGKRDLMHTIGQGTPAMCEWKSLDRKRKREDEGGERQAKRVRGEPRVVLKPRTSMTQRDVGITAY